MTERIFFRVHGRVQGVSFRLFTQKKAKELNITGWVRNASNNKVEGEAQGEVVAMQEFIKAIDRGPTFAHVVKLEKDEIDVIDGEEGFEVRRSY